MRRAILYLSLFCLMLSLGSCELIGDIFQAGMTAGIVIVVLVILLILWLVSKFRNRS